MDSENRKIIDSFLAEIGSAVGKNIRLNENGISAFTYDHLTFVIEVPENVSSFFLYTMLMALTQCNDAGSAMKKILQLNYLQQETRGGCIALDPMNDDIIFSYSDRVNEINGTEFRNILENFIDTALNLSTEIRQAGDKSSVSDEQHSHDSRLMSGSMLGQGPRIGEPMPTASANPQVSITQKSAAPAAPSTERSPVASPAQQPTVKEKENERQGAFNPQHAIMP
ncbi:MAG: CesT family type III secretion system chaperone [Gammaproteobacteria bacterium]